MKNLLFVSNVYSTDSFEKNRNSISLNDAKIEYLGSIPKSIETPLPVEKVDVFNDVSRENKTFDNVKHISNSQSKPRIDHYINHGNHLVKFGLYKTTAGKKYLLSLLNAIKDFKFPKIGLFADGVSFNGMKINFNGLTPELKNLVQTLTCLSLVAQTVADTNPIYFTDQLSSNNPSFYKLEWFSQYSEKNSQIIQACNGTAVNNTINAVFNNIYNVTQLVNVEGGAGTYQVVGSLFRASISMAKELFEQCIEHNMKEAMKPSRASMVFFFIMIGLSILIASCYGACKLHDCCKSNKRSNVNVAVAPAETTELLPVDSHKNTTLNA